MAGWTKAQYDAAWSFRVERHMPTRAPTGSVPGIDRAGVVVHYHKLAMQGLMANMWASVQPVLNILTTDHLCIVGAGFGWGVDATIVEVAPANIVGIDISDYIAAEQGNTEEAELRAEVALVGLDPDTGRGLEIMNFIFDGQPRSNVVVLQNDAASGPQRAAIRVALGGNWPSVVVYENIVDDTWTDQDIINARNSGNGFGGTQRLIWIYKPTPSRSAQDMIDLLPAGSEIIETNGTGYIS